MHADKQPAVALFATNDPRNYSGGRYHALIMAYALSHAGFAVTVYTDHVPAFDADLAPLAERPPRFVLTRDFRSDIEVEPQDWVVLTPTGIFMPGYYEAATDYAAAAGARLALINFESANWYNAVSPHPRDARLWDGWRRACLDGALVLSSARTSLEQAREFYRSPHAEIRHDVWQPPINSPLATRFDGLPRRDLVVCFVRPSDPHKGAHDLLALPPDTLAGLELALVAGREVDATFVKALEARHGPAGCTVTLHTRISDADKFRLLSQARLLLFPTWFEGYGYPPIEAAWCGTPTACYALPVLQETVGRIAGFAPVGDAEALGRVARQLLAAPPAVGALRAAVRPLADFALRAEALADLLTRHASVMPARPARGFSSLLGPVSRTRPREPGVADRPPLPAYPWHLLAVRTLASGELALTGRLSTTASPQQAELLLGSQVRPVLLSPAASTDADAGLPAHTWHATLPAPEGDAIAAVLRVQGEHEVLLKEPLSILAPFPAAAAMPDVAGASSIERIGEGLSVLGWALASEAVDEVAAWVDGAGWQRAAVTVDRPELAADHPGRPGYRAGFQLTLPLEALPAAGLPLLLLAGGRTVGAVAHWLQPTAERVAVRRTRRPRPEPQRLLPESLTNTHWWMGISEFGDAEAPSVFTTKDKLAEQLKPGTRLRFAGSGIRRVVSVQRKAPLFNVRVDGALRPLLDGAPHMVELLPVPAVALPQRLEFAGDAEGETSWFRGVFVGTGEWQRRGVRLRAEGAAAAAIEPGAVLGFDGAGSRTVLAVDEVGETLEVWLDGPVGPMADGAPRSPQLILLPLPDDALLALLDDPEGGFACGVGGTSEAASVQVALGDDAPAPEPGTLLRFGSGALRRVTAVALHERSAVLQLDGPLDAAVDGAPRAVHCLGPDHEVPVTKPARRVAVPDFRAPDPLPLRLARRVAPDAQAAGPTAPLPQAAVRPRVLFLTLVPPVPANQGNRVVTRNLIGHLIELGYDVDCLMQGWIDVRGTLDTFGDRLRLFHIGFPEWQHTAEAKAKARAREALMGVTGSLDDATAAAVSHYHPFFIVRDEFVDLARRLLQGARYDSIVCNYLHMGRVPVELAGEVALPPVCVVTHDALSRLPTRFGNIELDTAYRACSPAAERDALNAIPGALVVAISRDEQTYFRDIGVTAPSVLCEYDAVSEAEVHAVDARAFGARTLVYSASRNPMNVAGLGWFLDGCWDLVRAAVPEARLVICGPVCAEVPHPPPGVELAGDVSRDELFAQMRRASVAINPCIAGTGLKIKTVEAAAVGLPGVFLPPAVDGLQDVVDRLGILAHDATGFAQACIRLLEDEPTWQMHHEGSLQVAAERFAPGPVYAELDRAMGWSPQPHRDAAETPALAGTARDAELRADPGGLFRRRSEAPADAAVEAALARALGDAGEVVVAQQLAERAALREPTQPLYALEAAQLALAAGHPWQAVLQAAQVVAREPLHPEAYATMGEALARLDRHDEAVSALVQAIALGGARPGWLDVLEACYAARQDHAGVAWCLRRRAAPAMLGQTREYKAGSADLGDLLSGWSWPEDWGVWSDGVAASLRVPLAQALDHDCQLEVFAQGFTQVQHPVTEVELLVNGRRLGGMRFEHASAAPSHALALPAELLRGRTHLDIGFAVPQPGVPAELGAGDDTRRLGIGLYAIRLQAT